MPLESQEATSDIPPQFSSSHAITVEHDLRKYSKNYGAMGDGRQQEVNAFLDRMRLENATLRKPCPVCNNLVKPELLSQHNEAYHPQIVC